MKTINSLINTISVMLQSKWIPPAVMALTLATAFLGVTGCSSPHPH